MLGRDALRRFGYGRRARAPGPRGRPFIGSLPELSADRLGFLAQCLREHGSVVRLRAPWPLREITLVADAALAEQILITDAELFG
jgi:hypothetical protein